MNAFKIGIHNAIYYGTVDLFDLLTHCFSRETLTTTFNFRFMPPKPFSFLSFIQHAVMTDCPAICAAVIEYTDSVPDDVIQSAKNRGNTKIIEMLSQANITQKIDIKQNLMSSVLNKTAGVLDLIQRFVEFEKTYLFLFE